MSRVLTEKVTEVFTDDGYGGLVMLELDWSQDCIFERGDLNDAHESIEEHFTYKSANRYGSVKDWFYGMDEFTEIERE